MSRAVIHASTRYGGVGLIDFYTEQGCGQISMLMSHLRYIHYLHNYILSLIESFILLSGKLTFPCVDTYSSTYVQSPWIQTVQHFLHKHNATIEIPYLQTVHLIREFDQPIMNTKFINLITKSEAEMVNACRLYLQVNTLSEITHHNGAQVLDYALLGTLDENDS
jgi:hypothetical protein